MSRARYRDVRVETANIGERLQKTMRVQNDNLRDKIDKQTDEIARLRVSMAWMTVGVVTGLGGGLIALFEFL